MKPVHDWTWLPKEYVHLWSVLISIFLKYNRHSISQFVMQMTPQIDERYHSPRSICLLA